jgi:hypothetical protein
MRARTPLPFEILAGFAVLALALWGILALLLYQAHRQAIEIGSRDVR